MQADVSFRKGNGLRQSLVLKGIALMNETDAKREGRKESVRNVW